MKKHWVLSYPLSAQQRLIRLGGCPGWFESSLGAQLLCWFCHHVAAQIHVKTHSYGNLTSSVLLLTKTLGSKTWQTKLEVLGTISRPIHLFCQYNTGANQTTLFCPRLPADNICTYWHIRSRDRLQIIIRKYGEPTKWKNSGLGLIESVLERYWKMQHPSCPLAPALFADIWTQ